MFESLYTIPGVIRRHREAPLAKEREQFLRHLYQQGGTSRANLVAYASALIQIVRFLRLKELRDVKVEEIEFAASTWARYRGEFRQNAPGPCSRPYFTWLAKRWLRFYGRLLQPSCPALPFAGKLREFHSFMSSERGLSPVTIRGRIAHAADFLEWYFRRNCNLHKLLLRDADDYLATKGGGWAAATISSRASALRAFFRYAEARRWCKRGIAQGIIGPPVRSAPLAGEGPKWNDVRRLLRTTKTNNSSGARAKAILVLLSLYGLRRSEVGGLLLHDFNWESRIFTVRRSKKGDTQQFPIQRELAAAMTRYLRHARPSCASQHVFVTLHGPYRPIHAASISRLVHTRMQRIGISSRQLGPHSLRHACATRLLQQGASLGEIADYLGHRGSQCIGIYAKFDIEGFRAIADLNLTGAL